MHRDGVPVPLELDRILWKQRVLLFGHSCRWHPDGPTTGMESSPAIGAGIITNGGFLETRLRALETVIRVSKIADVNA